MNVAHVHPPRTTLRRASRMLGAGGAVLWLALCAVSGGWGCAPASAVVVDASHGNEVSRSPHGFVFRSEELEYFVSLRHERATDRYDVVVTSAVRQGDAFAQEPRFIEFVVDGERVRLSRWSKHTQGAVGRRGELLCTGVLARRCEREGTRQERFTWIYELPEPATRSLQAFRHGSVSLAVGELQIRMDLAQHRGWMHAFFDATASGSAYMK